MRHTRATWARDVSSASHAQQGGHERRKRHIAARDSRHGAARQATTRAGCASVEDGGRVGESAIACRATSHTNATRRPTCRSRPVSRASPAPRPPIPLPSSASCPLSRRRTTDQGRWRRPSPSPEGSLAASATLRWPPRSTALASSPRAWRARRPACVAVFVGARCRSRCRRRGRHTERPVQSVSSCTLGARGRAPWQRR